MCLYPRLIRNKKYISNKKNKGIVPIAYDERVKTVPVGCGNCIECRKQKSREWQVRLLEDIKDNKDGTFVTLTFSDESIVEITNQPPTKNWPSMKGLEGYELDNEIAIRGVRLFLERWRKEYGISLRHWLVTELGHNGTENIHLHGIVWAGENISKLRKIWKYGYVWKGKEEQNGKTTNYVNEKTVSYITKYITKIDAKHKEYKGKILCSKGIGSNYISSIDVKKNKYVEGKTEETYRTRTGNKMSLPVYWRNKIYTEEEKEKLWINKLDKQERWIMGEKIDISKGEEIYYKTLKYYQRLNEALGYGTDKKDWNRHHYERDRRNMLRKERYAKGMWKIKNNNKNVDASKRI